MTDHYVLDRIEGGEVAVLEDGEGSIISVPARWLPARAGEGDVLRVDAKQAEGEKEEGAAVMLTFTIDPAATAARRDEAQRLRDALPRAADGDLSI